MPVGTSTKCCSNFGLKELPKNLDSTDGPGSSRLSFFLIQEKWFEPKVIRVGMLL
jgi:hypothetical protein